MTHLSTWRPHANWIEWKNVASGFTSVTPYAFLSEGKLCFIVVGRDRSI
ncbi:MAG: hypothetical protein QW700_08045 [Desulfurococcaceae archaeon]